MSNPFIVGKKPREKTIKDLVEWLDSYGLRVYGSAIDDDGSYQGLQDFDAKSLVELMRKASRYE